MKRSSIRVLSLALLCLTHFNALGQTQTFHDYNAVDIDGDTVSLSQYYGKKVMVVNTASYCSYTPQFDQLQSLYDQYHQSNFEILGFPCNNFGNQDPHDDSTILDFCTSNYGVTFPMMHKVDIVTGDTAPVYKWLQRGDLNGVQDAHVTWNFNKFLIDEAGNWVAHYTSSTNPLDTVITNWIMTPSVISGLASENSTNNKIVLSNNGKADPKLMLTNCMGSDERYILEIFATDGRKTTDAAITTKAFSTQTHSLQLPAGAYLISLRSNSVWTTLKCVVVK